MRSFIKIFFCLIIALVITCPVFIGAESHTPATTTPAAPPPSLPINTNLPIPGAVPISGEGGQGPAALVANFYSFAFLIAGFLAFVMIVYGGVRYTFSGGNHSAIEEAKDAIKQALLGLGLLLVAYFILRTINPDLTNLRMPTLAPYVAPPPAEGGALPSGVDGIACGSLVLPEVDATARPFENGNPVVFSDPSASQNTEINLKELLMQVDEAKKVIAKAGGTLTVNSAYRPFSYQMHFYKVWKLYNLMESNPEMKTECADLWAKVKYEKEEKHNIGSQVAEPTTCAPHTRGIAVDISLSESMSHARADSLLQEAGVDLRWRAIPGDEAHYELRNPPRGC